MILTPLDGPAVGQLGPECQAPCCCDACQTLGRPRGIMTRANLLGFLLALLAVWRAQRCLYSSKLWDVSYIAYVQATHCAHASDGSANTDVET